MFYETKKLQRLSTFYDALSYGNQMDFFLHSKWIALKR